MSQRLKSLLPLSGAIGILAFAWLEISLNFTFHWVTAGDLGNGLSLPGNFHLVPPAAFVSWAMVFAAGADVAATKRVIAASTIGAVAGLLLMWTAPALAGLPDFWSIALAAGVLAFVVVAAGCVGDWYFIPGTFGGFATIVFWWIATGMDGWVTDGGGVDNSVAALGERGTAGAGAFGGVLSTPVLGVFASCEVTLLCGALLGLTSTKLAALLSAVAQPAKPAEHVR